MKRFYKDVAVEAVADGHALRLDGRGVKTPARSELLVPYLALAEGIAGEWRAQGDTIDPRTMPLTGLANAAIDRIAPEPATFAAGLARFGESDLVCYRAEGPERLVARQAELWDPFVAWARARYDVELRIGSGVIHFAQPEATVVRLARAVAARDAFGLAGLSPLVTVSGSLVIALALAEGAFTVDEAWAAASLDDQWQLDQWGSDAEAETALANRRADFVAGARFLELLAA